MDPKQLNPGPKYLATQLELINLSDVETSQEDKFISPDEARLRSEAARQALEVLSAKRPENIDVWPPEWLETYHQLMAAKWPWRIAAYIAWASSPKKKRWPKTQAELSTHVLGLNSPRQITTWREKNPAIDETIATLQVAPMMEHRADVFEALVASASDTDHRSNPDRKLYFEMIGEYTPRIKVDTRKSIDPSDLSTVPYEDLVEMEQQLKRKLGLGEDSGDETPDA